MSIPRNWESALDINIWKFVYECLCLNPSEKDNGISRVCRIMNIRWRAKLFPVINDVVERLAASCTTTRWNPPLLDLQEIIPGYNSHIADKVIISSDSNEREVVEYEPAD